MQTLKAKINLITVYFKKNWKVLGLFILLTSILTLSFVFSSPYKVRTVEILEFSPKSGSKDFPVNGSIDVVFKNPISQDNQSTIYTRFIPGIPYKKDWISGTQLRLTPQTLLTNGTEYKLEVSHSQQIIGTSMFTVISSANSNITELQEITKEDLTWMHEEANTVNASLDALKEKHPWYFNLPILTDKYAIIYNNKKNQFRISIYSKGMTEQEKADTLALAVSRLTRVVNEDAIILGYYVIYRDDYTPNGNQ